MNTSGTFTSTYGSPAVGYSSPAGNADKYGKGPLESPMVRVVQESVNLGNGEFRVVTEMKPVLTPAQKRMFSVIEKNETKGVSSDSSPASSPETAPESPKKTESKGAKSGAGKKEKQVKAAAPEKAPSRVVHRGSSASSRQSVSPRTDDAVEEGFTTTPVSRQPSVFKTAEVKTDGAKEGTAQPEDLTKEVKKEEVAPETTQPAIQAGKSQPRSKIKLLGVISLIAGIALAAFGFYTANFLAVNSGLGMMGFGSISYLVGRRIEAAQARKQYLLAQINE